MLPPLLAYLLPICSTLLLVLTLAYHLFPLLHLVPTNPPSLSRLLSIIPHPKRHKNLPREFFNLPPRDPAADDKRGSSSSWGSSRRRGVWSAERVAAILGIRGKIVLLTGSAGLVSLVLGWTFASLQASQDGSDAVPAGRAILLAGSVTILPALVACFSIFAALPPLLRSQRKDRRTSHRSILSAKQVLFRGGGITHVTLPRIALLALVITVAIIVVAAAVPSGVSGPFLGGATSLLLVVSVALATLSLHNKRRGKRGGIRLGSQSPLPPLDEKEEMDDAHDNSWITSPSRASTRVSSFVWDSPSDNSWLTSPATSQHTIPEWSFDRASDDVLPSPASAITRDRPRSPAVSRPVSPALPHPRADLTPYARANLPRPGSPRNVPRGSEQTISNSTLCSYGTSTPGSAIRPPGGSIVAAYSPDPFRPLPRNFQSLTSYPLSPDQLDEGRTTLSVQPSSETFTFVPSERNVTGDSGVSRQSSAWTLQSYHSAQETTAAEIEAQLGPESFKTPVRSKKGKESRQGKMSVASGISVDNHRAPPPPPLPNLPLPPTPTLTRPDTLWDWPSTAGGTMAHKESSELLMGERDRDWVPVERTEEAESWRKAGGGTGLLTLAGLLVCYALHMPILVAGPSDTTLVLYLISLLIPAPLIALASYLLRYRTVPEPATKRTKKSSSRSNQSASTHRSLALISESQLSLPVSVSPRLTPPGPKRASTVGFADRLSKLVEPKPSISDFGYNKNASARRHTLYEDGSAPTNADIDERDLAAEEYRRKIMARTSSGDAWLESGHAVHRQSMFGRAVEMLKPVPALQVLTLGGQLGSSSMDGSRSGRDPRRAQSHAPLGQHGVVARMRDSIVAVLPHRLSAFYAGSSILEGHELSRLDQSVRYEEEEVRSGPSPIKINIESPSKHERARAQALAVAATSREKEDRRTSQALSILEVETGEAVVEVATRGRMSASPTYVYRRSHGNDLDWLTKNILSDLAASTSQANREPLAGRFDDADEEHESTQRTPTKRAAMSSPPALTPRAATAYGAAAEWASHGRSSSIDFTASPGSSLRESPTKQAISIRQRRAQSQLNKHEQLGAQLAPVAVPRGDSVQTEDDDDDLERGVDLPPFPIDFSQPRSHAEQDLSTITEGDESFASSSSTAHTPRLGDVERMLRTPGNSCTSLRSKYELSPQTHALAEHARQAELTLHVRASFSPLKVFGPGGTLTRRGRRPVSEDSVASSGSTASAYSDDMGRTSMISEDEEMAREMERVLRLDTPTRTELVGAASEPSTPRAARAREDRPTSGMYDDAVLAPLYPVRDGSAARAEPPMADISSFKIPTYPPAALSHPHPPPSDTMPQEPHRTIGPHPSLHSMLSRKTSTDTMSTTYTSEDDLLAVSTMCSEPSQPSKRDVELLKSLRARAGKSSASPPRKAPAGPAVATPKKTAKSAVKEYGSSPIEAASSAGGANGSVPTTPKTPRGKMSKGPGTTEDGTMVTWTETPQRGKWAKKVSVSPRKAEARAAAAAAAATAEAEDAARATLVAAPAAPTSNGLRPLRLVANQNTQRKKSTDAHKGGKKDKAVAVMRDADNEADEQLALPHKASLGGGADTRARRSKSSAGSGKENARVGARGSKMSSGSGVSIIRA